MADDAKMRALSKMRQRAMDWHARADKKAKPQVHATEAESQGQELAMVRELKRLVAGSSMERRSIALEALHSFEEQLAKGEVPENLPAFVKNLSRKDGVRKGVAGITQKYGIAGASYYSMWGLDDREI